MWIQTRPEFVECHAQEWIEEQTQRWTEYRQLQQRKWESSPLFCYSRQVIGTQVSGDGSSSRQLRSSSSSSTTESFRNQECSSSRNVSEEKRQDERNRSSTKANGSWHLEFSIPSHSVFVTPTVVVSSLSSPNLSTFAKHTEYEKIRPALLYIFELSRGLDDRFRTLSLGCCLFTDISPLPLKPILEYVLSMGKPEEDEEKKKKSTSLQEKKTKKTPEGFSLQSLFACAPTPDPTGPCFESSTHALVHALVGLVVASKIQEVHALEYPLLSEKLHLRHQQTLLTKKQVLQCLYLYERIYFVQWSQRVISETMMRTGALVSLATCAMEPHVEQLLWKEEEWTTTTTQEEQEARVVLRLKKWKYLGLFCWLTSLHMRLLYRNECSPHVLIGASQLLATSLVLPKSWRSTLDRYAHLLHVSVQELDKAGQLLVRFLRENPDQCLNLLWTDFSTPQYYQVTSLLSFPSSLPLCDSSSSSSPTLPSPPPMLRQPRSKKPSSSSSTLVSSSRVLRSHRVRQL